MAKQSLKEDDRPATLWYWDDWFSSFDVRMCSLAARGLWMDMLGIMKQSQIKGTLAIGGKNVDSKTLAKISGVTEAEVDACIKELEDNGVFSRSEDGTIYNRRMYGESRIKEVRAEAGKRGAEKRWQSDSKKGENHDGKGMTTLGLACIEDGIGIENKDKEKSESVERVVQYFNEITGQKRTTKNKETKGLIAGRIADGHGFEDFKHVIDTKFTQWHRDPKMVAFLRPSTLFRPGNFEDYLNEPYQDPKNPPRVKGEYQASQVGEYKPREKPVFKGDSYSKVYEAMIARMITDGQTEEMAAVYAEKFMVTAECILRGDPQAFERWNKSSQEPEGLIKIVSDIVPDWKTRGEFAS